MHDCVVIKSLTEIPIDSEDFVESDVAVDDSDEDNGLERIEGLMVLS
jgi:hypothetical protein